MKKMMAISFTNNKEDPKISLLCELLMFIQCDDV